MASFLLCALSLWPHSKNLLNANDCSHKNPICPSPSFPPCELKNCEMINSAYRFKPCDEKADIAVFADFLYWAAKEGGLNYTITSQTPIAILSIPPPPPIVGAKVKSIHTAKNPGVRVGMSLFFDHDDWNGSLLWTHLDTRKDGSATTGGDLDRQVTTNWIHPITSILFASSVKAHWELHFNTLDAELGRRFWLGKAYMIQPFFGLKAAWIHQHFGITYFNPSDNTFNPDNTLIPFFSQVRVLLKNQNWGLGPRVGIYSSWHLAKHWDFYGKAAASLLFSWFDIKNKTTNTDLLRPVVTLPSLGLNDHFYTIKTNLELALGIQWESTIFEQQHLVIKAGWEQQYWFGMNLMDHFIVLRPTAFTVQEQQNLSLAGIVLGAQLEF